MMKLKFLAWFAFACSFCSFQAQADGYWQQHAIYNMSIDFDVKTHRYTGTQRLEYTNNSPDTLNKVFYHLYFNTFQPGSVMDVRSRTLPDPDPRVRDRISFLKENEIGYIRPTSLTQDGQAISYKTEGTILEVTLTKPILPGQKTVFEMAFNGQVPLQIRRSGRDSKEGIAYSMTQWYPKMSEYDKEGWHANPYIAREFHGIWGDFDVKISIDQSFVLAGTGVLQNPQEIGYGYEKAGQAVNRKPENGKLTWHFKAPRVHDFAWAADPDYKNRAVQVPNGPVVRLFYQKDSLTKSWERIDNAVVMLFQLMEKHFGKYPYETYSIIQGGDGGMEYPMATLITGNRPYNSLVGVIVHEVAHTWFQMLLATNEAKYAWMDEGFTSFAEEIVTNVIFNENSPNPHLDTYSTYFSIAKDPMAEPLTTHSDHYQTNRIYGINAYVKGDVFLHQLSYVMGTEAFERGMKRYFNEWKFKHPTPIDLKRVMEKESGLELDWYFEHWVETLNTIDYGIKQIASEGKEVEIVLERKDPMPMPIDLVVVYEDGEVENYYIPLDIMRGEKKPEYEKTIQLADWPWVYPTYRVRIEAKLKKIARIEIDPSNRMADVNRKNNVYPYNEPKQTTLEGKKNE